MREAVAAARGPGPTVEPDVDQVTLDVEGVQWTARLRGRSGGAGAPPLLLLGFQPDGSGEDQPELEALVVGRALAELSQATLMAALGEAAPPRDPGKRPGFFSDVGEGRRR